MRRAAEWACIAIALWRATGKPRFGVMLRMFEIKVHAMADEIARTGSLSGEVPGVGYWKISYPPAKAKP